MKRFIERRACPVCGELSHEVLRSAAFSAPEVWEFLERYYAGRIAPGAGLRLKRRDLALEELGQVFATEAVRSVLHELAAAQMTHATGQAPAQSVDQARSPQQRWMLAPEEA